MQLSRVFVASHILMVEPVYFNMNPETLQDNTFQSDSVPDPAITEQACKEFLDFRVKLSEAGIDVTSFTPDDRLFTPDAHFPNNWFSTDPYGNFVLYPMMSPNRRLERRPAIIEKVSKKYPYILDLRQYEERGLFLEGTGSIVMDHRNKIAYASLSMRTSNNLMYEWGKRTGYEIILFTSYDLSLQPVYHTNVMLCIAEGFAIVCLDAIGDPDERRIVRSSLEASGREIISISHGQMKSYCGNCLQLRNRTGKLFLVMSDAAYHGFTPEQKDIMFRHSEFITSDLTNIEKYGGGSARCMIAELF